MDGPPIFIIGSPRSGTTLLGNVLSTHPEVAYAEEPRLIWRQGNDRRSDYLRPRDARPDVVRAIRNDFERLVAKAGKARLLEKTPSNALRLEFMRTVFPEGRFVHIIRNPFDAVLSIRDYTAKHARGLPKAALLKRLREVKPSQLPRYGREVAARVLPDRLNVFGARPAWGPRLPGMNGLSRELDGLGLACLQWRACVESACQAGRAFPEGRYAEFHLEALDEPMLDRIMAFVGLEPDATVTQTFRDKFRPADPTGRRRDADAEDLAAINRWTEPTLRWLNYESHTPDIRPLVNGPVDGGSR